MRKPPTADDRLMQRARISSGDMIQCRQFIEAALALGAQGKDSKNDVTHLALVVAAVVYYARPFFDNEEPAWKRKRSKRPLPLGAPPLGKVEIGPLSKAIGTKEGRALHRSVLKLRSKIVAHAEARYFPVRMVKAFMPPESGRLGDFALKSGQTYPLIDLKSLRANASQLGAVFGLHGHFAAVEVRRGRKRLRRK